VKSKNPNILNQNKVFGVIATVTLAILSVPLVAMQFSDEVVWTASDFIVMGALLFGMGSLFVLTARRVQTHKLLIASAFLILTLYIWAELAVGVFTDLGS
jgi:hypothetical protein